LNGWTAGGISRLSTREWKQGRVKGAETAFGCESERDNDAVYHTPRLAESDAARHTVTAELSPRIHTPNPLSLSSSLSGEEWPGEREPDTDDDYKGRYWEWRQRDMQYRKKRGEGKTLFISTYQKEKGTVGREGRGVDWLRSMRGTDTKADRARQRVPQPIMAPGSLSPGACKNPVFM